MHPELLRALAQARHHDLLDDRRARGQPRVRHGDHSPRLSRARRRLGSLLMWAGARLLGEERAALKWLMSRHATVRWNVSRSRAAHPGAS